MKKFLYHWCLFENLYYKVVENKLNIKIEKNLNLQTEGECLYINFEEFEDLEVDEFFGDDDDQIMIITKKVLIWWTTCKGFRIEFDSLFKEQFFLLN